jgi:hypothetical protein
MVLSRQELGHEFVYPEAKAIALAKATNTPVLFTPVEVPVEVADPIQSADHPVVVVLKSASVMAYQPSDQQVELADVVTAPPAQNEVAVNTAPSLPATPSQLPLIALLGLLVLGSAIALRTFEKRLV